ncbi:MAG TPA: hypothetical protein VJZ00_09770 [Thermoanaerobaculia bacterium]|nr:hypothetical protein [Thermoanaerobaculia bacterium]
MTTRDSRSWLVGPLVASLSIAIVGIALLLPVNEYAEIGIRAFDCDGPAQTLMFLLPGSVLALAGLAIGVWHVRRDRTRRISTIVAGVCVVVLLAAVSKVPEVVREMRVNDQPLSPCR